MDFIYVCEVEAGGERPLINMYTDWISLFKLHPITDVFN